MRKIAAALPAMLMSLSLGAFAFAGAGCDGKFAGPPAGSITGTPGTDPLFGVTVFTFAAENPNETGFYNDIWFIDPGRDSDDGPGGVIGPWFADTMQALERAAFKGWITGGNSVTHIEVNNQYPLMLSFMSQWYRRNADGSRIRERNQFGQLEWSPKSLNINFLTAPVARRVQGGQVIYDVDRQTYPAGITGSVMFGWTSPLPNSPGDFPSPVRAFLTKNYSECGAVLVTALLPAGSPQITNALGIAIQDAPGTPPDQLGNLNVENIGTIPRTIGGGPIQVASPTGCFIDLFATAYRGAPVVQYDTPGHEKMEAVVEWSRHLGCLHANLVAQCCGLISNEGGSIMDSAQVIFQNGYPYTFVQKDIDELSKFLLPGKGRDPRVP